MISGRDLYTAAALLIREHGSEPHSIARNRAAELRAAGDEAGYASRLPPMLPSSSATGGSHLGNLG